MALRTKEDGLIVTQAGNSARVRRGRLNFLFPEYTIDEVVQAYRESVVRVRERLFKRRGTLTLAEFSEEDFADVTQEIALHWMYFYIINSMPVEITDADIDHPQSRHIIWSFLHRRYDSNSPDVFNFGAKLMGTSTAEFKRWLEGWKRYLDK